MIYVVVFFTSVAILAYEITFVRVFSFAQWQNISSVIITMALLGSGAAGTIVTLKNKYINANFSSSLFILAYIFPLFTACGFIISVIVPVNPYSMDFSISSILCALLYFILMCLPFFAGSAIVCVSFMRKAPAPAYAVNLFGSGTGGILPIALSSVMHPYSIMAVIMCISLIPVVILTPGRKWRGAKISVAVLIVIIMCAVLTSGSPGFRSVSQYKPVSGALNMPSARIIQEAYSPLSVIQVVEADALRSTSGLSIVSPYHVPVQREIFFDGDSPSPITPYKGDRKDIMHLEHLPTWLPYILKPGSDRGSVLIIGAGGGEPLLKALMAGFSSIDAVEKNSGVIDLMTHDNACYSGGIYLDKRVSIYNEDGRSFAARSGRKYDLIDISMLDTFNSAASGLSALNESYLYTVESFSEFCCCLSDRGILSVTRWITTPPGDSLKIFNTAVESLRRMKISEPGAHIMAIRSVQTITIMVSPSPFTGNDVKAVKEFCASRLFDPVYYPGIRPREGETNIRQDNNILFRSFTALLSTGHENFTEEYDWNISVPTDDRPYFYNFFKPAVMNYIKKYGTSQVPVTEWGYLLLIIILIPVSLIAL